ncbi:thioredoxin family protein [Halobacillus locisalis]|uniref:Thioredoxin family protein n=1 Tax=Halobacillus locisalis TaxID=220753 RepID=A0A838CW00_9BACI|nr:thioredoxin family protein [Halobacillus locisalis]MBA2175786.1 thioredoxin family protein [Halobacillus locisalis]
MNLDEWFHKGMTAQEYVDSMETHQENLIYIYENFSIATDDYPFFESLQKRDLRAIILTEDWCGDAMLNIPIYLRFAEAAHIQTHFLRRDENLELMDQYLTNGESRSIPKIIFLASNGDEIGTWGPRAPEIQQFLDDSLANLPSKEAPDYTDKQRQMLTFITKAYRDHQDFWNHVYVDLKETLK